MGRSAGKPLGPALRGNTDFVDAVAFTRDGRSLVSGGDTVRLWDTQLWSDVDELGRTVCKLVGSGFSEAEWAQYAGGIGYRRGCP